MVICLLGNLPNYQLQEMGKLMEIMEDIVIRRNKDLDQQIV